VTDDSDKQAKARVGAVVDDKWTLERLLGIGGMAAVYAARHRNGARAAVKVLHPDLSRHKEVRERFLREGYAANRVEHGGAVKVLDDDVVASGPEAGTAYIVMELLEGESMQDRLERGPPLGELDFLGIAASVLEVLEAAHARGVVHRDLKPENLFLIRDGDDGAPPPIRVKVLDFGLARLLQGDAITSYGLALGTPSFMSPEQAAGRTDEIDGRTDLFALAATGFRLCTGRRIHEAANPVDLVLKMAHLAAPRVRTVRPEVSEPCARVIDRALEFRRADRYESATAMLEDVRHAMGELAARGPTQEAIVLSPAALQPLPPLPVPPLPGAALPLPPVPRCVAADEQTTLKLSGADLETSSRPTRPALLPRPDIDESIRLPRNRSILPWLMLLAVGAIGVKWIWFGHRAEAVPPEASNLAQTSEPPSASVVPSASARAPIIVRDAETAGDSSSTAASAVAPPPTPMVATPKPSASQSTPVGHHGAPGKVGPGNVHKLPRKHHPKKVQGTQ
jgi:serine/threonine protein kinase